MMSLEAFNHVPRSHIPSTGTQAAKVLGLLSDGQAHTNMELLQLLECDSRSALQDLRGKTYGYWLIHNVGDNNGVYQLDESHLSGCSSQDANARLKRQRQLLTNSKNQAERESMRLPRAQKKLSEFEAQGRLDLDNGGDAA